MGESRIETIGPYEIIGPLGAGGMSEVYRARDTRLGREVALKLLSERLTQDPVAVDRFVREAYAVSALNHPNIVTIYEAGEHCGRRYIVMECVKGRTLRVLVAEQRPSIAALTVIAGQIARALEAAHDAGIVHRDIKPDNVMMREDGYVKVLDFGIARLLPLASNETRPTLAGTGTGADIFLGTPRYMSPEQIRHDTLTGASDIFSFGVMLYEWVTGRHPFERESIVDTVLAITSASPLPPSRLNPEIPRLLEATVLEMLQKDFSLRPSARQVAERLAPGIATVTKIPTRIDSLSVGRLHERAQLRSAFNIVVGGRGMLMGLKGEAGIGKTTIAEDLLRELTVDGVSCYVARGRCSERLAGTEAYLPWLEALESLMRGEGGETVAHLIRTVAPTWYLRLTVASDKTSTQLAALKAGSQERFKRELLILLEELSRLRPLVLFFDDVHWSDTSTVDLFAYLAARFDRLRVLILAAYRPTELQLAEHPFLPIRLDLQSRGLAQEIALTFLSRDDVRDYLRQEFPNNRFQQELLPLVYDKTEGSPLFMAALLRDLRDRAVIVREEDGWVLARNVPEIGRELPGSIRSLIEQKIQALDEGDRRLLVAASVQGARFDVAVVARALEADPAACEDRLDVLERVHGLVQLVGEERLPDGSYTSQYQFVHVLYQNGLYHSLRPARRAALSGAIARSLATSYGRETTSVATELALLFEMAGDVESAARYFVAAIRRAADLFADQEVIRLARRGLDLIRLLPDSPERVQLELELQLGIGLALTATQGYAAPEVEHAYTQARSLCRKVSAPLLLFQALQGSWRFYSAKGDVTTASALANELLALARSADDDQLAAVAHEAFSAPFLQRGDFTEVVAHMDQALALYDPGQYRRHIELAGSDIAVPAYMWSSLALWFSGYADQASRRMEQGLARARSLPHRLTQALALSFAAWAGHYRQEPQVVREHAEAALAVATEYGLGQWIPVALIFRGWALVEQGHQREGIDQLRQGLKFLELSGAEINRPHFLSVLAEAYLKSGQPEDGIQVLDQALAFVERNQDRCWQPELLRLKGVLLLSARPGAEADAEASFDAAVLAARRLDAKLLELRALASLSRLRRRQNRPDVGYARLSDAYAWFTEGLDTPDLRDARELLATLKSE
jgi:adenylate cyclase